jgi:hypothetical protein
MPVSATTCTDELRIVSDLWVITADITDQYGSPVSTTPTVTITLPDDSTATVTPTQTYAGCWRAEYTLAVAGRHTAVLSLAGYGSAGYVVTAHPVTAAGQLPGVADATTYLGTTSWTSADIADTLAAEIAAQRSKCTIPVWYPDDLRNALLRRVAHNLAMRLVPGAQPIGDSETGGSNLAPYDPEINRLEKPHYRWNVA